MPPAPRIVRPEAPQVAHAAALIRAGGLVAFPTETVYGLGGDATNEAAVRAIYAAKGRPSHNPMIIHCADADAALRHVQASQQARRLAARFWPGGLTLVLGRGTASRISPLACAGLPTVAIRVPRHPVAARLLAAADRPLAAPSANRSGAVSPTTARHVADSLGEPCRSRRSRPRSAPSCGRPSARPRRRRDRPACWPAITRRSGRCASR
jgi:L-threonylcarbamoyladenylate synthase